MPSVVADVSGHQPGHEQIKTGQELASIKNKELLAFFCGLTFNSDAIVCADADGELWHCRRV